MFFSHHYLELWYWWHALNILEGAPHTAAGTAKLKTPKRNPTGFESYFLENEWKSVPRVQEWTIKKREYKV